ncbi:MULTISPECIES: LysE family transporter [unclassified Ensifer]|uniref:LysE family translocator n=1 Tax=unclassified Ensifer TaxID=2633371 RepID=UPI000813500F|nr:MULTISPECIES: LysE family transporter [unclassified Ensifer]OCP17716.1 lysine transporter LysE [Ensifer sp. LC54]OCP28377.1 lysine transporter LysE [Ensifer sp. LC384]
MHEVFQLLTIAGVFVLSVVSPGPNFAIVTSTAMSVSRRTGVVAGLGLAAASLTWALLAVAGIGIILTQVPWIYTAVKLAGAAYLIWLGVKMVLGARKPLVSTNGQGITGATAFRKAYLVSMTSPKSIAFYGSIFSVMVPAHAAPWFYVAVVLMAALVSCVWYCGLALLFSHGAARRIFARAKTGIETTMGVALMGMGGKLLLSR